MTNDTEFNIGDNVVYEGAEYQVKDITQQSDITEYTIIRLSDYIIGDIEERLVIADDISSPNVDHKVSGEQGDSLFTEYGQFVLLLDADISALREPIKDCSPEQKKQIIDILEDQINDTYMQGNEELLKKFMYLWMYTIRKLDNDANIDERVEGFSLNFSEWEHQQFS